MLLGIDHVVVAVSDPHEAVGQLSEALGVEAGDGGRHDRLGTFNRLIWLGDSFIELIGVFDRGLAERSWIGAPTLRALDSGRGLATWAIATDDIVGDVRRLRATSSDLLDPMPGERQRPDGRVVRWLLATPPRLDPTGPPFLIEHDGTAAEWTSADRGARAAGRGRLQGIELAVPDVESTSAALGRTLGLVSRSPRSGSVSWEAAIGGQFVRLRSGGETSAATLFVSVDAAPRRRFELHGCRWVINA